MVRPSIGRIVWVRIPCGEDRPAIITRVVDPEEQTVRLQVFLEPTDPEDQTFGIYSYSAEPREWTWRWPERTEPAKPPFTF
jgi:hypothetical protein